MGKKILIAEDSPTQLEQLKYTLEKNGYSVISASDGQAALNQLSGERPELVISDILMPKLDGYQLCHSIKNNPYLHDIPVMLLTNLSDPQDVIKGLQAGADNFLTKPYNENFLISRIKYILINQEIRRHSRTSDMGIEIIFSGQKYFINSDRMQIIDLLLSTYENAIQKNDELAEANTKLTSMHRELELKNRELEQLNESKNRFLRMAAHDLRNPIGASLGYSMLLLEDLRGRLNEDEYEYLLNIKESSEFVLKLINDLLDIAVIEAGEISLNKSEFDIVSLISSNISLNKVHSNKKNIDIKISVPSNEILIVADSVKIEQVLNNLISNAIKFSFPGSLVEISAEKCSCDVVIKVKDQGQGIPECELKKLFSPFSRTSVRSTGGERSTGLGLSIVKKIIEAHSGKVWVESIEGNGSCFYFSLPKYPEVDLAGC